MSPTKRRNAKWTRERVAGSRSCGSGRGRSRTWPVSTPSELDLSGAGLAGFAVLEGANLTKCRLVGTDFTAASLAGADPRRRRPWRGSISREADLTGAKSDRRQSSKTPDLSGAMATGARFKGARFRGARAHQAGFGGCDMGGASFTRRGLPVGRFPRSCGLGRARPRTGASLRNPGPAR